MLIMLIMLIMLLILIQTNQIKCAKEDQLAITIKSRTEQEYGHGYHGWRVCARRMLPMIEHIRFNSIRSDSGGPTTEHEASRSMVLSCRAFFSFDRTATND